METQEDHMLHELKPSENRLPDYHLHTTLCNHAEGEVAGYRKAAAALEIPEICFVDHAPNPDGYDPKHRMNMNEFCTYQDMVAALMDHQAPHVLFGLEADYYNGCEAFLGKWLGDQDLDFVLGSVHYIEDWGFDNPDVKQVWNSVDIAGTWRTYFKLVEKLVETRLFDAVSHLDIPKKFGHRPAEKDLKEMVQPVLDKVAAAGMGMELNTSGLRKPVGGNLSIRLDRLSCTGKRDSHLLRKRRPQPEGSGERLSRCASTGSKCWVYALFQDQETKKISCATSQRLLINPITNLLHIHNKTIILAHMDDCDGGYG
jgi:histidinol-phosphatase (PHP family)